MVARCQKASLWGWFGASCCTIANETLELIRTAPKAAAGKAPTVRSRAQGLKPSPETWRPRPHQSPAEQPMSRRPLPVLAFAHTAAWPPVLSLRALSPLSAGSAGARRVPLLS